MVAESVTQWPHAPATTPFAARPGSGARVSPAGRERSGLDTRAQRPILDRVGWWPRRIAVFTVVVLGSTNRRLGSPPRRERGMGNVRFPRAMAVTLSPSCSRESSRRMKAPEVSPARLPRPRFHDHSRNLPATCSGTAARSATCSASEHVPDHHQQLARDGHDGLRPAQTDGRPGVVRTPPSSRRGCRPPPRRLRPWSSG